MRTRGRISLLFHYANRSRVHKKGKQKTTSVAVIDEESTPTPHTLVAEGLIH
jgi:hypothetical protein